MRRICDNIVEGFFGFCLVIDSIQEKGEFHNYIREN